MDQKSQEHIYEMSVSKGGGEDANEKLMTTKENDEQEKRNIAVMESMEYQSV